MKLDHEIELDGVSRAQSMLVFDDKLLVGEANPNATFHLFDRRSGERLWTWDSGEEVSDVQLTPAYSQGRLLLGEAGIIAAVRASDGTELWRDSSPGIGSIRDPILTGDLALYHGSGSVVAAQASTGEKIWRRSIETQLGAISLLGDRVYVMARDEMTRDLNLRALSVLDGADVWTSTPLPGVSSRPIIATEEKVFVVVGGFSNPERIIALEAANGEIAWNVAGMPFGASARMVLAQGLLLAVGGTQGGGWTLALKADTGERIYQKFERALIFTPIPADLVPFTSPFATGNHLIYVNDERAIQFRGLRSGELVWSLDAQPAAPRLIQTLTASGSELFALLPDRVRVYRPSFERYMPHFASGAGQATELVLANNSAEAVRGEVEFFADDGRPFENIATGLKGNEFSNFSVASRSSLRLRTAHSGELRSGWIRISADGPLQANSVYSLVQEPAGQEAALFEAGIASAPAQTEATVPILLQGNLNTALAFANPLPFEVEVTVTLVGPGVEVAVTDSLPSLGHSAFFIDELFPVDRHDGFEGSLRVNAEFPIILTALRTQNGRQLSSLPVSGYE
ncbi:MAG TPA: PQQ-binding-like beta-propeller repeat protein [Acidobacteriota bacterium]|nr:PQQ-binding-like beta-propeller repeat protein [Acidobacteriota bacterium]